MHFSASNANQSSLLLNNSWHQYEFGCDVKLMKTNESNLTFNNLIEHVEKQLIAAQNDVEDIKDQIYKTLREKQFGTKNYQDKNEDQLCLHL